MKRHRTRALLATMLLCSIATFAEHRFFPANSIHCVNVIWGEKDEHNYDPIEHEYKRHPIYYHYYTGNDTIVDGKPCVMLWKYCAETPEEKELRFLCEEDGLISYKYPIAEGGYSDWTVLYEFPEGGWKKGESYIIGLYKGKPDDIEIYPEPYTLLNSEETQIALEGSLIYGIGYNNWPFLEYWEFSDFDYPPKLQPHSFYRNDTLLWGKPATYGPFFPANSIRCTNMVTSMFSNDTTYYNLYTGSDTIVEGKECVQLWQYCTDTPEDLEQYLLLEEEDKVYIKHSDGGEWSMLYDFTSPAWHVGDSIGDAEFVGALAIESIDTITLFNGDTRQVANYPMGGRLIYGMGYADEPFFGLINRFGPDNGEVYHPVSFYYWNELLWGKELPKKREQRYFPANSVYTSSRHISHSHNLEEQTIEFDTLYTNRWTGNDTIVDGRECVVLWGESNGNIKRAGVIYESLNGVVYLNNFKYNWQPLYDFTPRRWKKGDVTFYNLIGFTEYSYVDEVSSITLLNGENVPLLEIGAHELIYGLGYYDSFLEPIDVTSSIVLSFYRNGVLLWGEEYNPNTSVVLPKANNVASPCYDLQGRKVESPVRGIYIKDGRKVAIK